MSHIESFNFSVGDFVFAKIKGYSPWPAIIKEKIVKNDDAKPLSYTVVFFGDQRTAKIKEADLYSYPDNIETYGKRKTENFKNNNFNAALKEAEKAFKQKSSTLKAVEELDINESNLSNELLEDNTEVQEVQKMLDHEMICTGSETSHTLATVAKSTVINDNDMSNIIESTQTYSLNESLKDLENSLIENNLYIDQNSEQKRLEIAAKLGSALLEENNFLKEKNLRLEAKLADAENKIEAMERTEESHIVKMENLLHQLADTQKQLDKEKRFQLEAQTIFEENDKKLGQIIDDCTRKIREQEKTIKLLENKAENSEEINKQNNSSIVASMPLIPTTNNFSQPVTNSPSLVLEIAELKSKQILMETSIKALTAQLQDVCSERQSNIRPDNKKQAPQYKHWPTRNNSSILNKSDIEKTKTNHFSVSLQVAKATKAPKSKTKFEPATLSQHEEKYLNFPSDSEVFKEVTMGTDVHNTGPNKNTLPPDTISAPGSKLPLKIITKSKNPPMLARIREEHESLEDFFLKYHCRVQTDYQQNWKDQPNLNTEINQDDREKQPNSDIKTAQQNNKRENQSNSDTRNAQQNLNRENQSTHTSKTVQQNNRENQPNPYTKTAHFLDIKQKTTSRWKTRIFWNPRGK